MRSHLRTIEKLRGQIADLDVQRAQLDGDCAALTHELANVRKAYEESSSRDAQIKDTQRRENLDLVRRLQNVEASNQQLSQLNAKLIKVSNDLAIEKDRMSGAMVTMWNRFEELITQYHKVIGEERA